MSKTSGGSSGTSAPASEIGTILAQRYEVMRELGRGGMGVVYLCRDLVTGERVALKRLRKPEGDAQNRPEETWWFQQEARAVASLDHPCIVGARDFGMLDDGSPYLAMDLLPGRSVHEWMYITHMTWPIIWFLIHQNKICCRVKGLLVVFVEVNKSKVARPDFMDFIEPHDGGIGFADIPTL